MDMRIGNSTAASGQSSLIGSQQPQQNLASLFAALQAGSLAAAQNAYTALTGSGSASAASVNGNSPLAAIGQALQQGDLAGAQKAATALQGGRSGHHHHHGGQCAAPPAAVSTSSSTSTAAAGVTGSLIDTTA